MYNTVFFIIVFILIFEFLLERLLAWLNSSWRNKPIPNELQGIYNQDKYKKQQAYARENDRFSMLSSSVSFLGIMLVLFLGGFGWLNTYLMQWLSNPILLGLSFFGILMLASDVIGLPFECYHTFKIEEKYGFNKVTPKLFIVDKLKGYFLGALIGGGLYSIIFILYDKTQNMFWIYSLLVIGTFMLFMTMFYSNLIVPLFNKQKLLGTGELRDEIEKYAQRVGFKLNNIYEIDGSKRSTRANAYFTGIGKKKRIVLYDTLIKELSVHELLAVLAHEVGHYKKKHTQTSMILSLLQMALMLYLLSLFISEPALSQALGATTSAFHMGLIAFALVYSPISTFTGILMNLLSRSNEYQADNFAAQSYDSEHLIGALKKLSTNNLSNLTPHPLYVWFNYSHPTLLQRIINLKK
jgi:STE24 endopeptidase